MTIWIPQEKCDFENKKFCKSMESVFKQQFASLKILNEKLRVNFDLISQNNNGTVLLYLDKIETKDESGKDIPDKFNDNHVMTARGKYTLMAIPNFCEFCGGKLFDSTEEVRSI